MHPQLTLIVAQQHIADLRRAADHNRLAHTATSSQAVSAPPRRRRASLVPALAPPPPGLNRRRARRDASGVHLDFVGFEAWRCKAGGFNPLVMDAGRRASSDLLHVLAGLPE
jgi:hypothetical protein